MPVEGNKRPPRKPRTAEEVEELVLLKKIREHKKTERFKKTFIYKVCNVFNIICFFIYCELVMCFIGPCRYETHYSKNVIPEHGMAINIYGDRIITAIKITALNGKQYRFPVNEFIEVPQKYSASNLLLIMPKRVVGKVFTQFW